MTIVNYDWDEDEDNIVEEYDDTGTTVAEYTTEPALFGNVVSQRRNGQDSVYHYDGQGSTLALTDSNGDVTDTYSYSAFGEVTAQTGSAVNPFQYIGKKQYYRDAQTGEYSVRRRDLSARFVRWLTHDPLGVLATATNLYLYVRNCAITTIDPSGLQGDITQIPEGGVYLKPCPGACGLDVTSSLTKLYTAFSATFALYVRMNPAKAQRACSKMYSLYGWDTYQLAFEEERFSNRACGTEDCKETVQVNGLCYKAEEVNYYLWGLANQLCYKAGFGTETYTTQIFTPEGFESHTFFGLYTLERSVWFVTTYRNLRLDFVIDPGARDGRVAWTEAGYAGILNAPKATVKALHGLNCTPCSQSFKGFINAYIGSNAFTWFGDNVIGAYVGTIE